MANKQIFNQFNVRMAVHVSPLSLSRVLLVEKGKIDMMGELRRWMIYLFILSNSPFGSAIFRN